MSKFKPISFYDRANNPAYNNKCCVEHPIHRVLSFEDVFNEKTGVMSKKSKYLTVDRKKEMENYKISDFSLSNMFSIGASLTPTKLVADTDMKVTCLENVAHSISVELGNNINNND